MNAKDADTQAVMIWTRIEGIIRGSVGPQYAGSGEGSATIDMEHIRREICMQLSQATITSEKDAPSLSNAYRRMANRKGKV